MKRGLFLFFLTGLLTGAILLKIPQKSFSQEATPDPNKENQVSTRTAIIKYNLAYPGILPDHPLYKLKVLRDKITVVIISDTRKKLEFYLLQADKGILATAMLVDKKKIDLAIETALKAEHNYTFITQEIYRLPRKPEEDFFNKLHTAALKHQEVLTSLAKRVPKDKQKKFVLVADFSKRNWQSIEKYKHVQEEAEEERKLDQEEE